MCHEILYFFLFLPIKNVKLSLDSWAIRNQKARGVGRTTMHCPPCIIPNNVYRNKPQQSIKVCFKYLDVSFISLLHPQFQAFHRHFLKAGSSDSSPPYPSPSPEYSLQSLGWFLIKIYPCQKKKLPIAISYKSYFPKLVWSSKCVHAQSFSKLRSGHRTALFPCSCHLSLILPWGPWGCSSEAAYCKGWF